MTRSECIPQHVEPNIPKALVFAVCLKMLENVWKCLTVDPSARTGEGWADSSNERVQFFHEAWQLGPREARLAVFRVICIQVRSVRYFGKRIFKVFVATEPSQVIISHHMLSRALTSFANVLCCCTAVQSASNFGQVEMHFLQDINFIQFPLISIFLGRNISSYLTNPVMRSCTAHTALESQLLNPG